MTLSELRTFIQGRVIAMVESKLCQDRKVIKEGYEDIEREMMVVADDDGRISGTELQDIAIEHGVDMDDEVFLKIYANVRQRLLKMKNEELREDIQYVIDSHFEGEAPESFNEFYSVFQTQQFDHHHDQSDVFSIYKTMTTNPNQLAIFENKKEAPKDVSKDEYTYIGKEPCQVCGSKEIYVGPHSGGWKSCAGCGTV